MRPMLLVLIAAVALSACSIATGPSDTDATASLPSTGSSVPAPETAAETGPPWAAAGLEFLDAFSESVRAGDIENALAFYHADAQFAAADVEGSATGWRQIGDMLERLAAPGEHGDQVMLIGDYFASIISPPDPECGRGECPAWIDVMLIYDGAIGLHLRSGAGPVGATDPIHTLYVESAEQYSAHSVEGMRSFYSDAVFADPFPIEEYEALFEAFPELTARPMTLAELDLGDSDLPALFDLGTGPQSERSRTAVGVYDVTFGPGVRSVAATMWSLWDNEIVEAATMFDPDGWDEMLESADLEPPPAWFRDIATPSARSVERTHVIEIADGGIVELFDASDVAADLVRWSLGRFDEAALTPPHVDAIYVESELSCLEESAWTHLSETSAIIRICLDESDLRSGGEMSIAGKVTMLHELGHVWTAEYLTDEQKAAFVDARGLPSWNDASTAWDQRGTEHASEILAWGLMDTAFDLIRLGEADCEDLIGAFWSLTGADPLHGC